MTMWSQILLMLQCAVLAVAWLPKDTGYFSKQADMNTYNDTIVDSHRTFANRRYIPGFEIRGVNLGSLFVVEPWMASTEWATMGCGSAKSEYDCVSALGQTTANANFAAHWQRWITDADLAEMQSYGLNTIRVPVGYWMFEGLVYQDSEHFPQGGLAYLETLCGWATARGMYIIIDLHGAPGAQVAQQPFTGQCKSRSSSKPTIYKSILLTYPSQMPLPLAFMWITSTNGPTGSLVI